MPLASKDVMVERSLAFRPPVRMSLATAVNCICAARRIDSADYRRHLERDLRRGVAVICGDWGYVVIPEHVDPTWEPTAEEATK